MKQFVTFTVHLISRNLINKNFRKMLYDTQTYKDPSTGITWWGTGEVLDRISAYDHEEIVTGEDDLGNQWEASASVSCGEICEIFEPELVK